MSRLRASRQPPSRIRGQASGPGAGPARERHDLAPVQADVLQGAVVELIEQDARPPRRDGALEPREKAACDEGGTNGRPGISGREGYGWSGHFGSPARAAVAAHARRLVGVAGNAL